MTRIDDRLAAPYRAVRPIASPADGPWPGMLTSLPSGERAVLVDADVLGSEWRGWDAAPDGHVLGALDVVRTQGGHEVVLPVCPETLEAFLVRRHASTVPIGAGEAVTVGVSLLRGCAEALVDPDTTGTWWLTEAGRPVIATDASSPPILDGTLALLDVLGQSAPHRGAWADAASALSAVRLSAAELDRAELGLFSIASPVALDMSPAPTRPAGAPIVRVDRDAVIDDEPRGGLMSTLARHVDADLADLVSRATTSVWRRSRTPQTPRAQARRAPLLVGAAVAAGVLGVGLMWPGGAGSVATAEGGTSSRSASPTAVPTTAASPTSAPESDETDAAPGSDEKLEVVATELLHRLDACDDDSDCGEAVALDGGRSSVHPVEVPAERRAVVLLDDFGGVAVLRVDDVDEKVPSQLIVIARRDGEWLLRDVNDAVQQP